MGLTMSRKRDKNLAFKRKSHYFIETLLVCFHACPLSRPSFILEFRNAVFSREGGGGGGTSGLRDLEKDPGTKATTKNKLSSHPLPESNRDHWWQWYEKSALTNTPSMLPTGMCLLYWLHLAVAFAWAKATYTFRSQKIHAFFWLFSQWRTWYHCI